MSDPVVFPPSNAIALAPPLMVGLFQALLQGILIDMTWTFFSNSGKRETLGLRAIVLFLTLTSLAQTGIAFHDLWYTFVTNFGNWQVGLDFRVFDRMATAYQASMAAPVQGYYIWRCYKVTGRNRYILSGLGLALVASWTVAVVTTHRDFTTVIDEFPRTAPAVVNITSRHFVLARENAATAISVTSKWVVDPRYVSWLISTALLDGAISFFLLKYLFQTKSQSSFKHLDSTIKKLVYVCWEAALPPASLAILTCILYLSLRATAYNFLDLACEQLLGKLYAISLMMTLNARISIAAKHTGSSYEMARKTTQTPHPLTAVRIDIHTITEGSGLDMDREHEQSFHEDHKPENV